MVISAWMLALLLGPGVDEGMPPTPTIEQAPIEEAPIEGPTPALSEPGIEFATEPPAAGEEEIATDESTEVAPEPSWPTPGDAPPDGWGFVTTGAILMPSAALLSWWLLTRAQNDRQGQISILATTGVLELMGIGGLAMGLYRHAKLKRWTLAYRVVARPQGAGLLAAGGISLNFGVALIIGGGVLLGSGSTPDGATALAGGIAAAALIAPLTLHFGQQRRQHYQRSGGWYRPSLPTVQLAPRLIIDDTTFGLGLAGRF